MDATSLQLISQWANGTLAGGEPARTVTRVCTDSRRLRPGDLFIALRGEAFDGHQFVAAAAQGGAAAAIVDGAYTGEPEPGFTLIRVADTLKALQDIAAAYRASLPMRVIALTGSSGKTSTKDLLAAVLGRTFRVLKTEGNFNNHIGVPLTLLSAGVEHEIGIVEMGMNHPGEIAPLAAMATPESGVITNIGTAHIEFLHSREGIAEEKGRLAEALPPNGFLILKADDDFSTYIAHRSAARVITAGIGLGDFSAEVLETGISGSRFIVRGKGEEAKVSLPVPGLHMIENALLALAAGSCHGIPLSEGALGLAASQLTHGRLEQKKLGGIDFLDDTYNANPDSMRAALRTLATLPVKGRRIAVLGRMGELGGESERGHRSVGAEAAAARVDLLLAVGGAEAGYLAQSAQAAGLKETRHLPDPAAAAVLLAETVRPGDLVLVKGSRSARMERIFEHPAFQTTTAEA
ncbi:MAG: UDP-N-acetylmuramoyl-tripeptide--D-alanyl-D-alanine ligase [Chthoniobacteraceae bacterium]